MNLVGNVQLLDACDGQKFPNPLQGIEPDTSKRPVIVHCVLRQSSPAHAWFASFNGQIYLLDLHSALESLAHAGPFASVKIARIDKALLDKRDFADEGSGSSAKIIEERHNGLDIPVEAECMFRV